jgi:DNA-binding NtrC family response regulator
MPSKSTLAPLQFAALIGDSPAIVAIRAEIETIADSNATVLITGPSGSGKDVVAQRLHQRSHRAARPLVALNCAAVARDLLESELFGHEAGAFTGAIKARPGRFEAAHGGTLFLDEVGDMALAMQAKLLRALETRVVERVGSMLPIKVDVRLCAATSVDLIAAIDRGNFRGDLLYRLDVIRIRMPALAERPEDIPLLVAHFAAQLPGAPIGLDDRALALLAGQPWLGNVRELKNFVERAQAHFPGAVIGVEATSRLLQRDTPPCPARTATPAIEPPTLAAAEIDLKAALAKVEHACIVPAIAASGGAIAASAGIDLKAALAAVEQAYIISALAASGGAIAASAKRLGLQRTTLIEKMRRLHITSPRLT